MKLGLITILVLFFLNCGGDEPTAEGDPLGGFDGPVLKIENAGDNNFKILFGNFILTNILSMDLIYEKEVYSVNESAILNNAKDFGKPTATFTPGTISMIFSSAAGVQGAGTILEFSLNKVGVVEQTKLYFTNVGFKNSIGDDIYGNCSITTQTTNKACADANGIWVYEGPTIKLVSVCHINGYQSAEGWNDFDDYVWSPSFCDF